MAISCGGPENPPQSAVVRALRRAELEYERVRQVEDAVDVARSRGKEDKALARKLDSLRWNASLLLGRIPPSSLLEPDLRALGTMLQHLERSGSADPASRESELGCEIPANWPSTQDEDGFASLSRRLYRCFGKAAEELAFKGERLDRLSILGRLSQERDETRRKALFFALEPLWKTVNGDDRPDSPYRRLIRLASADLARQASSAESKVANTLGIPPEALEPWLVAILEKWRDTAAPGDLEPWDLWLQGGEAGRLLDQRIALHSLRTLNDLYYDRLGADVRELGLRYDLDPRPGKTPVAFTTFGRRNHVENGKMERGEFWIFATYREGGLGNLGELLHETGHGIHLAAIDTRPAFQDWPDNDTFTEALADMAALEIYEPDWQREYLGMAVPLPESIKSKYAPIVMDVAWGLFELRMLRDPDQDPNRLWTRLTHDYLGVRPHPELSWWALRGQLFDSPGYMLNYAVGAVLVADMRDKAKQELGPFWRPNRKWYPWISEHLLHFGKELSSAEVLKSFLGRPPNPNALLADMSRIQTGPQPEGRRSARRAALRPEGRRSARRAALRPEGPALDRGDADARRNPRSVPPCGIAGIPAAPNHFFSDCRPFGPESRPAA